MTLLERALLDAVQLLEDLNAQYMLIGGLANAIWGEPRATLDVDISVAVPEAEIPKVAARIGEAFTVLVPEPAAFVQETRVLPLESASGVRVDLIFALIPFELEALDRARGVAIAGRMVRVVTPEDLILMKIISDRPRDVLDAEGVVRRHRASLDRTYLEPRLREFAAALERNEILERWEEWTRK